MYTEMTTPELQSLGAYLRALAEKHRMSPARIGVLFEHVASNVADTDRYSAVRVLARCLQRAKGDEARAAREVMKTGPWRVQHARGTGAEILLTIPAFTSSRLLLADGSRLRIEKFTLAPDCEIWWRHQPGPVADITAVRQDSAGDLLLWCTIRDSHPDIITAAIFGELACSPRWSRATVRHGHDTYRHEDISTVIDGDTVEISLTPFGTDMLPTTVRLATPPRFAAQEWQASRATAKALPSQPLLHRYIADARWSIR